MCYSYVRRNQIIMELLRTEQLSFTAGNTHIRYPDLVVEANKMTFLSGPSGCGKSTLFRLLNGTLTQTAGRIFYRGTDTLTMDTLELRRQILLVNQQAYLFDGTVEDNFRIYNQYRHQPVPAKSAIKEYLYIASAHFDPTHETARLSGGERQRVFNAVMLSLGADIYLWDEPSSALDTITANAFFYRLRAFNADRGITSLVITHDDSLIPTFSDALITLDAPRLGSISSATAASSTNQHN